MKIIIEGTQADFDKDKAAKATWGQIVEETETFLLASGKVPSGIRIDGKDHTQEQFLEIENMHPTGNEVVEIGTMSLADFLIETLQGVAVANKHLIQRLKKFAAGLSSKRVDDDVKNVTMELENFFGFWSRLQHLMPKPVHELSFSEETLNEFLERLQKLVTEIVDSMTKDDFVLAADLMSYELIPAIETIEEIIPRLNEVLRDWKKKLA